MNIVKMDIEHLKKIILDLKAKERKSFLINENYDLSKKYLRRFI